MKEANAARYVVAAATSQVQTGQMFSLALQGAGIILPTGKRNSTPSASYVPTPLISLRASCTKVGLNALTVAIVLIYEAAG